MKANKAQENGYFDEEIANELNLKPMAKIIGWASAGCDPDIMGIGPVPATKLLMKKRNRSRLIWTSKCSTHTHHQG